MQKNERFITKKIKVSNDTRKTKLNNNDMVIGGSGSGKTGGYVIPNLVNLTGSMIISDTKGKICTAYRERLEAQGVKVYVLDFVNPERSVTYNPLSYIRRDSIGNLIESDIKKVATALMPVLDSRDPFWEKSAKRYISMLIAYIMESAPPEKQNMMSIVNLNIATNILDSNNPISVFTEKNKHSLTARIYKQIENTIYADRMRSSIAEFVNEALEPFNYMDIKKIFYGTDCFDITKLGEEKSVLFLNSSDNEYSFSVLSDLFYSNAFTALINHADKQPEGRLKVPVRIILDDFAAASKIEGFENIISIIRSRDISVSIILQSLSQLSHKYNPDIAATIVNNCDHLLYLGGHDYKTMQMLSLYMDKSIRTVMSLPVNKAILIRNGREPEYVDKTEPYSPDIC